MEYNASEHRVCNVKSNIIISMVSCFQKQVNGKTSRQRYATTDPIEMHSKEDVVVLHHVTPNHCTRHREEEAQNKTDSYKWTKCGVCVCDQNTPYNNRTQQSEDIIQYNGSKQSHSYIAGCVWVSRSFCFFLHCESADDELNRFVAFWCLWRQMCDMQTMWKKRERENTRQRWETMISARCYEYESLTGLNVRLLNIFLELWYRLRVHYHYGDVDESIRWKHSLTAEDFALHKRRSECV